MSTGRQRLARLTSALPYLLLAVFVWILSSPSFRYAGAAQDEGLLLVYPELILKGLVPNLDFLAIYGPGAFWILALAYRLFGVGVEVERAVGLAYHVLIVLLMFALVRRYGSGIALWAALIAAIVLVPLGLAAYAWLGATVFALGAFLLAAGDRPGTVRLAAAGLAVAAALSFRPDMVAALLLAAVPLVLMTPARWPFIAGAAGGALPLLLHALVAGPWNVIDDIALGPVKWGPGRQLPLPGPEPLLLGLVIASVVLLLIAAARPRPREDAPRRLLLALALFALGTLYQAIQRADLFHLIWAGTVPVALLPLALTALFRPASGTERPVRLAAVLVASLSLAFVAPSLLVRATFIEAARGIGLRDDYQVEAVEHNGRLWYPLASGRDITYTPLGSREAVADLKGALEAVDSIAPRGSRLFVGPRDLRRTNVNETVIYYLLPHLRPATYYLQLDPGSANAPGSRLAANVASADVLLLTSAYDDRREPNASMEYGPDAPNEAVRSLFTLVSQHGDYWVYMRR